jgi:hypothetical protein
MRVCPCIHLLCCGVVSFHEIARGTHTASAAIVENVLMQAGCQAVLVERESLPPIPHLDSDL